jgi:hypothetical protein
MNIGYGYMWGMPATAERHTVVQENRIHEQLLLTGSFGRVSMLQRLRNEHRWVQYIANDKVAALRYSDRVHYLLSLNVRQDIPHNLSFDLGYMRIFQQKALPQVYERHDVLRLFFYRSPDLRKSIRHKSPDLHHPTDE